MTVQELTIICELLIYIVDGLRQPGLLFQFLGYVLVEFNVFLMSVLWPWLTFIRYT